MHRPRHPLPTLDGHCASKACVCVCDTALARCSNMSKKHQCSLLPYPHAQRPCSSKYRDQPDSPPEKMRTGRAVGSEMILPLMHTALLCSLSHQKGA